MELYEVKAGKVDVDFQSGQATPIAGQGKLVLGPSSEDPSFLGAKWVPRGKNRNSSPSEDLLLVPGDVQFSHVPECLTGRVIEVRFQSSVQRHQFWLQEATEVVLHKLSAQIAAVLAKLNACANTDREEE